MIHIRYILFVDVLEVIIFLAKTVYTSDIRICLVFELHPTFKNTAWEPKNYVIHLINYIL